jgi:trafficking protein particle complex subunit 4
MAIHSLYILNKHAGLIYSKDFTQSSEQKKYLIEIDKEFEYPLNIKLDKNGYVILGANDVNIRVGYLLLSINNELVYNDRVSKKLKTNKIDDVEDFLNNKQNYPVKMKFGKNSLSINDKLSLTGRFFGLYSLSWQLSPIDKSSGIEYLETDSFKLYCYHTLTGLKFITLIDNVNNNNKELNIDLFLKKTYELYTDYALKNPFYLLDQPIQSDNFDNNLTKLIDSILA